MIRHTFSILNGIGEKFERNLWRNGILSWDDFCSRDEIFGLSNQKKHIYSFQLQYLKEQLSNKNSELLASYIKKSEHWRLYNEFAGLIICLDIETNGLPIKKGGHITLVGLYDGFEEKSLIRGENLSSERLAKELKEYKYLITFYGSCFDIPFLKNSFPDIQFNILHFDLFTAARKLGLNGGMKKLENLFGFSRDQAVQGLNGYDAVKLWHYYQKGSLEAKEVLVKYNMEDTKNLYKLAEIFYKNLRERSGIDKYLGVKDV
ncbi:MAG: ribonuclease H-like domain-containing protein [Thermodesulfovibrionales bacterium]|nr:ribonuclease H-like domain-containing protein [Thermodesulfovibrionales bacterium]